LREGPAKDRTGTPEEKIGRIKDRYNNTHHTEIKYTPRET
jgi:hypothetical protein